MPKSCRSYAFTRFLEGPSFNVFSTTEICKIDETMLDRACKRDRVKIPHAFLLFGCNEFGLIPKNICNFLKRRCHNSKL